MSMQLLSGSLICQFFLLLWRVILNTYERSRLARIFRSVAAWWKRWWHGSALVRFLIEKEGSLPRAWPHSIACRLLSFLVNLPVALFHWLYLKFKPVFEASFFAQLAFGLGEQVPAAAGWLILLLMNIPYERWNNAYSLISGVLLFLLAMAGGMRRRSLRMDAAAVGPYVVCFLFAVCLSWPLSYVPAESFRFLYYHFACALCVLVIVSTVERAEQLERLAGFGCLGMLGTAVYGVIQRLQGVEVSASNVDLTVNADMPGRVYSFYDNSNAFAHLLVLLIPVGFALLFGARRKRYRLIGLLSAVLGCAALLMTYTRAAWLGLAAAAVVFVFLWKRKFLPIFVALGIAAIPLLPASIFNRILTIFNTDDSSISSRVPIYEAALRMIQRSPVTGAGLGTAAVQKAIEDSNVYHGNFSFVHAHNTALQIWMETGLLGVAAFIASMYHALKKGAKAVLQPSCSRPVRMVVMGTVSGLAGALVCGLADYLWSYPRVMLIFWFTVALLLAGIKLAKREAAGECEHGAV